MAVKILKPPLTDAVIANANGQNCYLQTQCASLLQVGSTADKVYRTLLQFDLSSLPFLATIISGTLNLFVVRNEGAANTGSLGVFQILSPWGAENVTWDTQPLTSSSPIKSISGINHDNIFLTIDITTLIQDWTTNRSANLGVLLKFLDESCRQFIILSGKDYPDSRFWPYLELNILDRTRADDLRLLRAQPLEQTINVVTQDSVQCTSPLNILLYDYSYIVVNTGATFAVAYLQVSPDTANWLTESEATIIAPGAAVSYAPNTIAKYARLCYQSHQPMQSTSLRIFIQGRTYN